MLSGEVDLVDLGGEDRDLVAGALEQVKTDAGLLELAVVDDHHPLIGLSDDVQRQHVLVHLVGNVSEEQEGDQRHDSVDDCVQHIFR